MILGLDVGSNVYPSEVGYIDGAGIIVGQLVGIYDGELVGLFVGINDGKEEGIFEG